MKKLFLRTLIVAATFVIVYVGVQVMQAISRTPSNAREWKENAKVLPRAEVSGDTVTIFNVRDFRYDGHADFPIPAYAERTYNLDELETVWFGINPFGKFRGIAHTFVSFGFTDGQYVTISVETRLENGERYSPWTGLLNRYELIYQIGDENDIVRLRTNYLPDEKVYLYPIRTTPERMRAVFLDMIGRANELYERPEFYNTLTNNCTSNLVQHVNALVPDRVPAWSPRVLLPGYSDHLAYDLGLIDTDLPWKQVREYFYINDQVSHIDDDVLSAEFSELIRKFE